MAFLGLAVPHETARLLSKIDAPGKREPVDAYHITLLYLGKDVPMSEITKAIAAAYEVAATTRPFTVRTNLRTTFPGNEDGVPVICRVQSDDLMVFRARLAAAFDQEGVSYSKRFEYNPHMTLSYADAPVPDQEFPLVEWGAHEMVLWAGDQSDDKMTVTFPFTLETPRKDITAQVVVQRFINNVSDKGTIG